MDPNSKNYHITLRDSPEPDSMNTHPSTEPPDFDDCFICTEPVHHQQVLLVGKHYLHLPCLIEILKNNKEPKHPLTNVKLSEKEITLIETAAFEAKLFCPTGIYRTLFHCAYEKIDSLEQLARMQNEEEMGDFLRERKGLLSNAIFQHAAKHHNSIEDFLFIETIVEQDLKRLEMHCLRHLYAQEMEVNEIWFHIVSAFL